jgi:SNF2 family DNA or RNA helicase
LTTQQRADDKAAGKVVPLSKLATLGEICVMVGAHGPEVMVPQNLHGSQDAIVPAREVGVTDVTAQDFVAKEVAKDFKSKERIVVFTMYAQFHQQMSAYLESLGLGVETISGEMNAKQRDIVLKDFRAGTKEVLIISNVGSTGIDLTFARTSIIYVSPVFVGTVPTH